MHTVTFTKRGKSYSVFNDNVWVGSIERQYVRKATGLGGPPAHYRYRAYLKYGIDLKAYTLSDLKEAVVIALTEKGA